MFTLMEWSTEVGEADWFLDELAGWDNLNVGRFVPSSLPAIGRLFHPVETDRPEAH